MTDDEIDIITAKHNHGCRPSEIARQLEIPVRIVTTVTGRLPITQRMTADTVRETMGRREFTIAELAGKFHVEHTTAGAHLRALEKRGAARRVRVEKVDGRSTVVWIIEGRE